jgi:hypothetical protein
VDRKKKTECLLTVWGDCGNSKKFRWILGLRMEGQLIPTNRIMIDGRK